MISFSNDKVHIMIRYKVFLSIVETKNFTKTAEVFGYTQSAVSQIVRSLEEELKVTLFTRTKRGIFLTSDGKAIEPFIRRLCNEYSNILDRSSAINKLEGSVINVGTFASVSANFLPYVIKKFKIIYPTVQFNLLQADYDTVKTWIKDGKVDFGFLTTDIADKLESIPIMRDEMVMIMPKNHPKAEKRTVKLSDFAKDPFIFLDQGKKNEPMEYFYKAGIEPNEQFRVYDDYTIMNMVEQGLGVAILPKLVLQNHHQDIKVRSLTPMIYREMCVAYKSEDSISFAGKTFMDFCVREAKGIKR